MAVREDKSQAPRVRCYGIRGGMAIPLIAGFVGVFETPAPANLAQSEGRQSEMVPLRRYSLLIHAAAPSVAPSAIAGSTRDARTSATKGIRKDDRRGHHQRTERERS